MWVCDQIVMSRNFLEADYSRSKLERPYSLFPIPYSLFPILYSLYLIPYIPIPLYLYTLPSPLSNNPHTTLHRHSIIPVQPENVEVNTADKIFAIPVISITIAFKNGHSPAVNNI